MRDVLADLRFHHMGLAVRSEETANRFLTEMDYRCGPIVYDPEQNVHLRMCEKAGALQSKSSPWATEMVRSIRC